MTLPLSRFVFQLHTVRALYCSSFVALCQKDFINVIIFFVYLICHAFWI